MAYCDVCGNFDKSYLEEGGFNDEWNEIRKKSDENYQPNLYIIRVPTVVLVMVTDVIFDLCLDFAQLHYFTSG